MVVLPLDFRSALAVSAILCVTFPMTAFSEDLQLSLRFQQESSLHSGRFHQLTRDEVWKPEETAIIVCDVWDLHHCLNAVRRLEEFVPRLNDVLTKARAQGVTIIHAPSDCMPAYANHPARQRAISAPRAAFIPYDCEAWCSVVPAEERAVYPIDQSDGGEDDDPAEHAEWAAKLKSMGRNPGLPWARQSDMLTIDKARDFISDKGDEVWNVLQQNGIRNVILTGVHTNMCVLGRPFGLRQMARNGKNVVLMRDMTDTMYNPQRWPYVTHFTGTDLIVSHIERYVCPTVTSEQILGGDAFRFKDDDRPHLVMLIAEDEYLTEQTLPRFAVSHLGREFRVTTVFGSDRERHSLPGVEAVKDADVLLVSIRRRVLPEADMKLIRDHVKSGRPVVGIRTASHAFSLGADRQPPEGFVDWPEFDAEVFGGNYHGHHGNRLTSMVTAMGDHAILDGVSKKKAVRQGGSLYLTSPLEQRTTVLTTGMVEGESREPVTWTFSRADGGRSFYSSMGHVDDFVNAEFTALLYNGICWAAGITPSVSPAHDHWSIVDVPTSSDSDLPSDTADVWYRCAVRLPADWLGTKTILKLTLNSGGDEVDAWFNGHRSFARKVSDGKKVELVLPQDVMYPDDANLLVLRLQGSAQHALHALPELSSTTENNFQSLPLRGRWQRRTGSDTGFANIPLPAKFGASADIVFSPNEPLWTARPVTQPGEFTPGIEGPACDADGNVFAVNYQNQGTIGRVSANGSAEVFVTLPDGSVGNGIRFDRDGNLFVADYPQHNILKINAVTREITTFAHNAQMNQPNDISMAPDGTLYASDPAWKDGTGQLWRIDTDGTTTLLAPDMGTTNGVEVSPDGTKLYVNESVQRNVWAFDISSERLLKNKRLIRQFDDHGFDGMRCDVDGNLYITRHGKGTVVKMTPHGKILQEIDVLGKKPSNLCFGGPDGRTIYVTEVDGTRLVSFRVDRPGRSWAERQQ
jgi:sugar lactone lactonase YvrE/type 1 glutamine amidotransferase/nicotinamidase-related amidase